MSIEPSIPQDIEAAIRKYGEVSRMEAIMASAPLQGPYPAKVLEAYAVLVRTIASHLGTHAEPNEAEPNEIERALLAAGNKINAVKEYRYRRNCTLRMAKDAIDALEAPK